MYRASAESEKAQAQKIVKGSFLQRLFDDTARFQEAAEHFEKAANFFKLDKSLKDSAECYVLAADNHKISGAGYKYSECMINAAKCYKDSDPSNTINFYTRGIDWHLCEGKIYDAARHEKHLAEYCESKGLVEDAVKFYSLASDHYEGLESQTLLVKIAYLIPDHIRAGKLLEENAKYFKFRETDILLDAGLSYLAEDSVGAKNAASRFTVPEWEYSKHKKFLLELIREVEAGDTEEFEYLVKEWDSVNRLNPWRVNILLKIKNDIETQDDMC